VTSDHQQRRRHSHNAAAASTHAEEQRGRGCEVQQRGSVGLTPQPARWQTEHDDERDDIQQQADEKERLRPAETVDGT